MSASKLIGAFLSEQRSYLSESDGSNSGSIAINNSIKLRINPDKTDIVARNRDLVRKHVIKSIDDIDSQLTKLAQEDQIQPQPLTHNPIKIQTSSPENLEESRNFLKRIYMYISKKQKDLKWSEVDNAFTFILTWLLKLFGIAGSAMTVYKLADITPEVIARFRPGKNDNPAAIKFLILTLIPLLALVICIYCIFDAVKKSNEMGDESRSINLKEAVTDVLNSIKKSVMGKVSQQEINWAVLSSFVGSFAYFVFSKNPITKWFGEVGTNISKLISNTAESIEKRITEIKSGEGKMNKFEVEKPAAKSAISNVTDIVKHTGEKAAETAEKNIHITVNSAQSDKISIPRALWDTIWEPARWSAEKVKNFTNPGSSGHATTVAVVKFSILAFCTTTIVYLIVEMVDHINKNKLIDKQENGGN